MLTKGDLDQIRKIVKEETHYSFDEKNISTVSIARDISKILEGLVSILTQGDKVQAQLQKATKLLEQHISSTKQK